MLGLKGKDRESDLSSNSATLRMHVVTFSGLPDLKVNGQPLAGREAHGDDEGVFEKYFIAHICTLGPQKTGDGARSTQPWYIMSPGV